MSEWLYFHTFSGLRVLVFERRWTGLEPVTPWTPTSRTTDYLEAMKDGNTE